METQLLLSFIDLVVSSSPRLSHGKKAGQQTFFILVWTHVWSSHPSRVSQSLSISCRRRSWTVCQCCWSKCPAQLYCDLQRHQTSVTLMFKGCSQCFSKKKSLMHTKAAFIWSNTQNSNVVEKLIFWNSYNFKVLLTVDRHIYSSQHLTWIKTLSKLWIKIYSQFQYQISKHLKAFLQMLYILLCVCVCIYISDINIDTNYIDI